MKPSKSDKVRGRSQYLQPKLSVPQAYVRRTLVLFCERAAIAKFIRMSMTQKTGVTCQLTILAMCGYAVTLPQQYCILYDDGGGGDDDDDAAAERLQ